ncbi:cytochrome c biogenesis protein ResB [Oerskovia turbata]
MNDKRIYRPEGIDDAYSHPEPEAAAAEAKQASTTRATPSGRKERGQGAASDAPAPGPEGAPQLPSLGLKGTLRWMWRQLTSMRVALMLLMLLAVAAVPGSVLPQRPQDPAAVLTYLQDNPGTGEWLDRLGFFDVYASVWFSAIYILLFVSLVGCILPRTKAHLQAVRNRPPRTPRRFDRFPAQAQAVSTATPDEVVAAAEQRLRGRLRWLPTFRVDVGTEPADPARGLPERRTVAAERGYLRETGNLVFHLSLLGLLVAVATGQLLHFRGQAIIIEGQGFANAVVDYDTFENGSMFSPGSLVPFSMTLDSFEAEFATDAVAFAQSRDFTANVTVNNPDGTSQQEKIKVNHPIVAGGAKIYLQGNGYAPEITVHDAEGEIAFAGQVPFLPEDTLYTSRGVVKVPDTSPGLDQIGLVGYFLPTAEIDEIGARSIFPQPANPMLVLEVYRGDLGLDEGLPQNVYRLNTDTLTPSVDAEGERVKLLVAPGETVDLPDGLGTITFAEGPVPRFVALDLRHDPALFWILVFSLGALAGLAVSLFTPRRRVWLRVWSEESPDGDESPRRTVVTVAGLARGDDAGLQGEVDRVVEALPGLVAPADPSVEPTPAPRGAPSSHTPGQARADRPRKADR